MAKEKSKLSLSAKAKKFDVPLGTLKKVYRRGVAAWNSGHRPGTTPQQWGHARVNSYLRKGKTYHTADKDLHESNDVIPPRPRISDMIRDREGALKQLEARNKALADLAARQAAHDELVRQHNALHAQSQSPEERAAADQKHASDDYAKYANAGRYMGDSVEYSDDINKLFEDQMDEGIKDFFSLNPQKNTSLKQTAIETGLGFVPGVGQALALRDLERARRAKDPVAAAQAASSFLPVGRLVNAAGKARKIFVPASKEASDIFKTMEKAGKTREEIWSGTKNVPGGSVFRNPQTGELKQEIDDSAMKLIGQAKVTKGPGYDTHSYSGNISNVLKHDELLNKVPSLKQLQTNVDVIKSQSKNPVRLSGSVGGYSPSTNKVRASGADENAALKIATHELQHAVDKATGAKSYGSSPQQQKDKMGLVAKIFGGKDTDKKAMQNYLDDPGEVQARAAEARRSLTPQQRQERPAWLDYQVSTPKPITVASPPKPVVPVAPKPTAPVIPKPVAVAPKPVAPSPKPVTVMPKPAPAPAPLPIRARSSGYVTAPPPSKSVRLTAESIEDLNEMQLVGTDEYRQHAITMTPGQDQEIENAFPFDEYGVQNNESPDEEQTENVTDESNGEMESSDRQNNDQSFKSIRKRLKEQEEYEEETEETEEEVDEPEDDGAEDGIDFTPNLKTKKTKSSGPVTYAASDMSGLPVLTTAANMNEAIEYHVANQISLVENVYRPGSDMFFAMLFEAKRLYSEGNYTPKDEYEQDLLESDIGEVAEYEGQPVVLDFPFEEDLEECWKGYTQKGMKKKGDKMVPNCVPMNEEGDPTKGKGIGKPFRSGGGGAVYVRSGKGNIIKVNFSQSGMRKRINEPARVRSFMARHHCLTNKDRTSASYWACRWPRYFSNTGQRWW